MSRRSRIILAIVAYVMFLKFFEKPIAYFFETLKGIFETLRQNNFLKPLLKTFFIIYSPQQKQGIGLRCGYIMQFLLI